MASQYLLAAVLLAGIRVAARADVIGLHWTGAGEAITDAGGAFGVPLGNWWNLSSQYGATTLLAPNGGAITVTWTTGGGVWLTAANFPVPLSFPTFSGYSTGDNQVFSGCLYAQQNDTSGVGPISVTVSGMNSVASGNYTLELMTGINGPDNGTFRSATVNGGTTLAFNSPTVGSNGSAIAAVTPGLSLSGDSFSFTIVNDSTIRAELSGLTLQYTAVGAPVITTAPQSQDVAYNASPVFTVAATGSSPFTYQWQFNDVNVAGATSSALQLSNVSEGNSGNYRVKVTDNAGRFIYSQEASLLVAAVSTSGTFQSTTLQIVPNMAVGDTAQADVWANFQDATNSVTSDPGTTYQSSNTNLFTVNSSGLVTACGLGMATLTATYSGSSSTQNIAISAVSTNQVIGRRPPMEWSSWNHFQSSINDALFRGVASAMVTNGMKAAGYQYLAIDDDWASPNRDANGNVVPNSNFPNNIKPLADYIHNLGLKFAIYTCAGTETCAGETGSYGYEAKDVATYAAWGADYVKVDWCYTSGLSQTTQYPLFQNAIRASGRPMVLHIYCFGENSPWLWGPGIGTQWRTAVDIMDSWGSMLFHTDINAAHGACGGHGHWNDPDMMEVGNGTMSDSEYQTQFSLWCEMDSPLLAGNDPRSMTPSIQAILTNPEAIAVNQDLAGFQGTVVRESTCGLQVWSKPLYDLGARAVLLLNRNSTTQTIAAAWSDLGLSRGPATVRDVWQRADMGVYWDHYAVPVAPHAATMLIVRGTEASLPSGTDYLSDLSWKYVANTVGPAERDLSNGNGVAGGGKTITIRGQTYAKGVGVAATSEIRVWLGGNASSFQSNIGIDDEVSGQGSVIFQVWGDNALLYQSVTLTGTSAVQSINVNVAGVQELRLRVIPSTVLTEANDHADWANARIVTN